MPVHSGMGDGHAAMGDGEHTGSAAATKESNSQNEQESQRTRHKP